MKKKNFTLIELLTVIMIIGILMSMAFVGYGRIQESKLKRAAELQIKAIEVAINDFYEDKGYWPTETGGELDTSWVTDFDKYLSYDQFNLVAGVLKDPWGNAYVYDTTPAYNIASYDLLSKGKDGAKDTDDDITNY